jgi:ABC-type antimicrobial peptide transport system permease subunit
MIRNYLKIAWRNLFRNRVSAFINIGGLATGMTVALLIGLWIWSEFSFDKQYKNHDRIARVMQNQIFNGEWKTWQNQAMQLGPELRNNYGSNFKQVVIAGWTVPHLLTFGEKKIQQQGNFMEPGIADLLSLEMVQGSKGGLTDPNSILLSQTTARNVFGNAGPMNQVLKIDNRMEVKVSGIYKDLPDNSTFSNLSFIAPFELLVQADNLRERVGWGNSWFQCYVQIADNATMEKVSENIKQAKAKVVSEDEGGRMKPTLLLHPMSKWHLYGEFKGGFNTGGDIQYVWLMGTIGIFVLLLACINFMNLSTARSEKRAREVGIRKAIGSLRSQLVTQFFSESLLVAFAAFILSLILTQITLPFFNELSGKKMTIMWSNPVFWLLGLGFSMLTGLIAGSYPAIYLSSFKPVKVLKGRLKTGRLAAIPRKALVVLQFTVSVTLIICTITVFRQIQFAKNRPIGYDRNSLVTVPIKTNEITKHYETFRREMLSTGVVEELAATDVPITETYVTNSGFTWPGKDPSMQEEFVTMRITSQFGKTVNWKVKEGRDFSPTIISDSTGFILNEAAVKYMGLKNPPGTEMIWGGHEKFKVIGVVEDLVTQSPYEPARPMIFFLHKERVYNLNIKISQHASPSEAIQKIAAVIKKYDPDNIFEYKFINEEFARKFANEERIGKLASFFTILAVFISCLGLFGLATYVAEQRTKEIGVRKVLGASVTALWQLLTKDFVWLVIISLLFAIPASWYFMDQWLLDYQYRAELSWWIFAAAGTGALLLTIITVSFQALKAAFANPMKALRTE